MARRRLGREALLDAASVLMDERGIDNVSLNEINRASGHHNRSAVNYHFGSRDAVVRELFSRTMAVIDAERNALLDHMETTGGAFTPRAVTEVAIGPLARQLRSDEGRRYLRLCGQLVDHPRFCTDAREILVVNSSVQRCAAYLAPSLSMLRPDVTAERVSIASGLATRALADQARLIDNDDPPRTALPIEAFTANLVDMLLAILNAPTTIPTSSSFKESDRPSPR
jgi:AcrR family transcriptional regulator